MVKLLFVLLNTAIFRMHNKKQTVLARKRKVSKPSCLSLCNNRTGT